ncbi:MAG: class I SAM-dependent methyltransferase [Saprospiraceae bacterium]|nr:class I SAM-dependent methyltransferase [Saprospiraceae bacterium]
MDKRKTSFDSFNDLASAYEEKFMGLDIYNDTYDAFCDEVKKPGAKILELACGPGNIARYLLKKRPDFGLFGTDGAANMVALAQKNNPSARFEVLDVKEINSLTPFYDGIVCGFLMPYLSREACDGFIRDSAKLLCRGGVLYFSTIEGDYSQSGLQTSSNGKHQMYVYYHDVDYLTSSLNKHGFEVKKMFRIPFPKGEHQTDIHLVFLATRK